VQLERRQSLLLQSPVVLAQVWEHVRSLLAKTMISEPAASTSERVCASVDRKLVSGPAALKGKEERHGEAHLAIRAFDRDRIVSGRAPIDLHRCRYFGDRGARAGGLRRDVT
jgi:hypothetical protein